LGQVGAVSGDGNTAVGLNGSSQYVEVPYRAALNPSVFTVESWVYLTGGAGTFRSVLTSREYPRGFMLYASDTNTWQLWLGTGSDWARLVGPAVTLNAWTHLAASFDGTTARLYVNGVLAASAGSAYAPNTSGSLRVGAGRTEGAATFMFPGRIDETAVYNTVLSPARIQAHTQAALTP
jgi:hypothetical protein